MDQTLGAGHILFNHADAEDAVQNTFVKIYTRKTESIDTNIKSYLFKTAYTTCLDIIKKRKRISLFGSNEYEESYIDENLDNAFSDELKDALMSLKPLDRGLVFNRVINDMSYKELSHLYGKSEANLRKRYERLRNKLWKYLEYYELKQGEI